MAETGTGLLELVPGRVYRLGGSVERDGRISWVPRDSTGFEPINCYLVRSEDEALLINTGVAAHAEQVLGQLDEVIGRSFPVSVFMTRAEQDTLGNLGAVIANFNTQKVYTAGAVRQPFDFFDDANSIETVRDVTKDSVEILRIAPGADVPVGTGEISVFPPPVRLLTSWWAYDSGSKIMFPTDMFGQVAAETADQVVSTAPADIDSLRSYLMTKFDWLAMADTTYLLDRLAETRAREVKILAPDHGCIIVGEEAVASHFDAVEALLREFGENQVDSSTFNRALSK